ncbi:MAG TPA: DUF3696 domain-containing protein [Stellaceae bacterium]|nr:DUF3696 domain-containing protein [Stellaceae bacterium]
MLRDLRLDNFKSWKSVQSMKLATVTGLFGTNSSGKSSLIQSLLLLKQSKESADRAQVLNFGNPDSYANLGTYKDIVFDHDTTLQLSFGLSWTLPRELSIADIERKETLTKSSRMGFDAHIGMDDRGALYVSKIAYSLGDYAFSLTKADAPKAQFNLSAEAAADFVFKRNMGRAWPLPGPVKFYGFPDQTRAYFQNAGFLSDLELALEKRLDSIFYLGPLREFPSRDYLWSGSRPVDVGQRGENAIDALLASRAAGELVARGYKRKRLSVEAAVADWLQRFGLIASFKVEEIAKDSNLYRVSVKHKLASSPVLITDVGFGVSQILPVLVLLHYVPEGSTLLLEQPEIHLHPSVQSALADLFVEVAQARKLQIFFESHSEHLLLRLQRLIAEQKAQQEELSLYFCDKAEDASSLERLDVDIFGNIRNWPKNFFGDAFGEAAAMQKAQIKRQLAAG